MRNRHRYPADWDAIALKIKNAVGWKCEECGRVCRRTGESKVKFIARALKSDEKARKDFKKHPIRYTLTVAHLNHQESDCRKENLKALCSGCHLIYDGPHHVNSRRKNRYEFLEAQGQGNLFSVAVAVPIGTTTELENNHKRIRPFSNGTAWDCWYSANCNKCSKYDKHKEDGSILCEIDEAILEASAGIEKGTVSYAIALKMGIVENGNGKCSEFEPYKGWYVVGESEGLKGLLLGSYATEEEARNAAETDLKKCFDRLKADGASLNAPVEAIKITVEELPTKSGGQFNIILYHVNKDEKAQREADATKV